MVVEKHKDIFDREQYYDKDEKISLNELVEITAEELQRTKLAAANEIIGIGNKLINEKEKKKERFESTKQKHIKYILKNTESYFYDELNSLTYHDVKVIYLEIKQTKKVKLKTLLDFMLNVNK